MDFSKLANSLGSAIQEIGTYSANAAARANNISAAAQAAQGAFNQASADNANTLNMGAMANQYGFNSAMMQSANEYNTQAWNNAAAWNEKMWQKQADFNAEQAQIQRDWQERMANTQYQRAIGDMEKAGLNPILAVTGAGIGTGVPGGATASAGSSAMGAASSQMASGGLLGASTASEGNYMGQMEQMGTTLALLGAIFSGISSAADAAGGLGAAGQEVMDTVSDVVTGYHYNEDGERVMEYKGVGKFASKMRTEMGIATMPGSSWAEKKSNYYRHLATDVHNRRELGYSH